MADSRGINHIKAYCPAGNQMIELWKVCQICLFCTLSRGLRKSLKDIYLQEIQFTGCGQRRTTDKNKYQAGQNRDPKGQCSG